MNWLKLKAWPWLKKHWMWILFPIGILAFIATYKKMPDMLSSETVGAADVKKKADDKAASELGKAKADRDAALAGIEKDHAATVAKLTRKQREEMTELREDPDKLNDWLIGIGKDIRG